MNVTLEDIHNLAIWKDLITIGCRDLSDVFWSPRREEINIKLDHETLGIGDSITARHSSGYSMGTENYNNLTLFQTGYLRYYDTKPNKILDSIRGDRNHVMTISEWESRLTHIFDFIFEKIVSDENRMGFTKSDFVFVRRNRTSLSNKFSYLLNENPSKVFHWLNEMESEISERIIDLIAKDIIKLIKESPGRMAIGMKGSYKNPAIIRIINSLDKELRISFKSDLGLVGDLNELGI